MKKKTTIIITVITVLVSSILGMLVTNIDYTNNVSKNKRSDYICYYGCPNSKKVKKLNLLKSRRRIR